MAKYRLEFVQSVVGDQLKLSKPGRTHQEHEALFADWAWTSWKDTRSEHKYRVGPDIREPGLEKRWAGYERDYLKASRISKFWHATLTDAVVEPSNFTVASNGRLIRETIKSRDVLEKLLPGIPKDAIRNAYEVGGPIDTGRHIEAKRDLTGRCCLLGYGLFGNYFNWTIRYAPSIRAYQALARDCLLLVPSAKQDYIAESLEFFGVPENRVHYVTEPVRAKELVVFSPNALGRYDLSPQMIWNLREHPQARALWSRRAKKLYIPRRNVKLRRVTNERDLEASLEKIGFTPFDCAAHPVREQAAAFKAADVIVAPHGAGLSNIVYCKPGTRIIEIIPEGYDQGVTSYRSLADLFGLRHEVVFAREERLDTKGNRCNSDIRVDVPFLESALAS